MSKLWGYDSFGRSFGYQALFGEKFEEKEVQSLLKDLPLILKLQFIITVEEFWKVYSYEFTVMKSLRINRFLGNLVWILEAYTKYKIRRDDYIGFKILLKEILEKHPTLYDNFNILITRTKNLNTNDMLKEMNDTIDSSQDLLIKQAACIVIAYRFRNHTAHNLSEDFLLFKDSANNKRIFCCILWVFLSFSTI